MFQIQLFYYLIICQNKFEQFQGQFIWFNISLTTYIDLHSVLTHFFQSFVANPAKFTVYYEYFSLVLRMLEKNAQNCMQIGWDY